MKTHGIHRYAVTGTVTTTYSNSEQFSSKDYVAKTTSTYKLDNGFVTISWNTNANTESNYTTYNFNGRAIVAESSSTSESKYDGKALSGTTSSNGTDGAFDFSAWTITDVNGTKYIDLGDNTLLKIEDLAISEEEDAFSGDIGGEFALNIKVSTKDRDISYTKENSDKVTNESTTEYKLTFQLVESYEPDEEAEEE